MSLSGERGTLTVSRFVQQSYAVAYIGRNRIKRAFCRLKDWRHFATRYDKLAINFQSAIEIAAVILWWT